MPIISGNKMGSQNMFCNDYYDPAQLFFHIIKLADENSLCFEYANLTQELISYLGSDWWVIGWRVKADTTPNLRSFTGTLHFRSTNPVLLNFYHHTYWTKLKDNFISLSISTDPLLTAE